MFREQIENNIKNLRSKGRIITNCYANSLIEMAEKVWMEADSLMFCYDDHGVKRLIYFASGTGQLERLLMKPDINNTKYILEFLTRDKDENRTLFENVGYQNIANMMRMSNTDCIGALQDHHVARYRDDSVGRQAEIHETAEINRVLWDIFDTEISHLVNDNELEDFIINHEVSIHRNADGLIDAILQVKQQPRKFYINQIYNGTNKNVIHAMLQKRLHEYRGAGGKYVFAWVEENNIASVKFHQKYGMEHDGMWDLVYSWQKG